MILSQLNYPTEEKEIKKNLDSLFLEWYKEAKNKTFINDYNADDIVFDGFYPYYSFQKKKVLFIGREALGIDGLNYIDVLYDEYKNNTIGEKSINQSKFHSLMFYLTYGINHNCINWDNIPYASDQTNDFGTNKGISFAFMNLSKFSNESDSWHADWNLIDSFTNAFTNTKKNYFNKEIEILDPDVIVTMNLEQRLSNLGKIDVIKYGSDVSSYYLNVSEKKILLLDTFHFSAPKKAGKRDYYEPFIKACKEQKIV